MICPITRRTCIDDLCSSGSCFKSPDLPTLTQCGGCGALVGMDGNDPLDECECPLDDDFDDED